MPLLAGGWPAKPSYRATSFLTLAVIISGDAGLGSGEDTGAVVKTPAMPKKLERKLTMATMEAAALPVIEHIPGPTKRGPNGHNIFFNSCPRCSGTRYLDRDQFGWYVSCVACGYAAYLLIKQRGRPRAHMPDEADPPRRAKRISFSSLRLV